MAWYPGLILDTELPFTLMVGIPSVLCPTHRLFAMVGIQILRFSLFGKRPGYQIGNKA